MKKYETPEVVELTLAKEDILVLSILNIFGGDGDGKDDSTNFGEFHRFM